MISYCLYKLGAFFSRRLPSRLSEQVTEVLARIVYGLRIGFRRRTARNLRIALGSEVHEEAYRRLTKEVFLNFGRSIYYFLRLPSIGPDLLLSRCRFNGIDEVTKSLRARGGFIMVGPHLGPWEVGGACLAAMGNRIYTVALPHPSAIVTRFFNERRRMAGIETTTSGESIDSLRRALQDGKTVALLIDRPYGTKVASFRYFGREVPLPIGHIALAVRYKVPILTSACVFSKRGRFEFVFGGPHYPSETQGASEAMNELQSKCLRDIEGFVRRYPEQWFHFKAF